MKTKYRLKILLYYSSGLAIIILIILFFIQKQILIASVELNDKKVEKVRIILVIDSNLNYFLNNNSIDKNEIESSIKELLSNENSLDVVVLHVDKTVSTEHLKEVAERLKKIPVKIAVATQPE